MLEKIIVKLMIFYKKKQLTIVKIFLKIVLFKNLCLFLFLNLDICLLLKKIICIINI